MKTKYNRKGSLLIVSVFVVAMISTLVIGMLQINTEEIKLMQSQIYAAQALALAEGGLNKAMAQIRNDPEWREPLPDVPDFGDPGTYFQKWQQMADSGSDMGDGFYNVGYDGSKILITAGIDSWYGYTAIIEAEVTVSEDSPHIIRIDAIRINKYQSG